MLRTGGSATKEAQGVALMHKEALGILKKIQGGSNGWWGSRFEEPTSTSRARVFPTLAQQWRVEGAWQGSWYEVEKHAGVPKANCRVPEAAGTSSQAT